MTVVEHYLNKLEKSPEHTQIHSNSWADYIELVCLANFDREVSVEDIVDRLSGRVKDLSEDSEEALEELEDLERESETDMQPSRRAEIPDKWDTRVSDYFKVLSLRVALYGDDYPFSIVDDCLVCKPSFQDGHLLYIYLLLCSNLYLFDDVTRGLLANYFELICFNAFQKILPTDSKSYLFGKNPINKKGRYSKGTFWNKLKKLVKEINEKMNPHVKPSEFSNHNTGDDGLDLIGLIPTGDKLSSSIIHFAQCACTYDFTNKQHSSSFNDWAQKISFKNPPTNSTFIPHCYRGADGSWINSTNIKFSFLLDRKRILNYYTDSKMIKFSKLPIYKLVSDISKVKEKIF